DRVALVAFAGGRPEAVVALPLTASVRLAADRLERVPLSGRTPLADALRRARLVLRAEMLKRPTAVPLVVIVSDGLPTQPLRAGGDPVADALEEARLMRRAPGRGERGCARPLLRCHRRRGRRARRPRRSRTSRGGDDVTDLTPVEAELLEAVLDPRIPAEQVPATP